jgi:oxygen-independent coproporphyrinogen III oxidase
MFIKRTFNKVAYTHFLTDYSSIDYIYPPIFAWNKISHELFLKHYIPEIAADRPYLFYIHFPFCSQKCLFCRQYSLTSSDKQLYVRYEDAIIKEIILYARYFKKSTIMGVYCGGGTPTLLPLKKIIKTIKQYFQTFTEFTINVESTLTSLNESKLLELKEIGITRLLIGIQTLDEKVLANINRSPQKKNALEQIIHFSRSININCINAELIAGLPGQTKESFLDDLKVIVDLGVDSVHCYPLLITPLTALWKKEMKKEVLMPSPYAEEMWQAGAHFLKDNGYSYKGDDFCRRDDARNPLYTTFKRGSMWGGILGVGVSAISHFAGKNTTRFSCINTLDIEGYINKARYSLFPIEKGYILEADEVLRQYLIRACRYNELDIDNLQSRLARDLSIADLKKLFEREFKYLEKVGGVCYDNKENIISFSTKNWFVDSKCFFSRKILHECKQKMKQMRI